MIRIEIMKMGPYLFFITFGDTLNCLKKIKDFDLFRSCGCVVLLLH